MGILNHRLNPNQKLGHLSNTVGHPLGRSIGSWVAKLEGEKELDSKIIHQKPPAHKTSGIQRDYAFKETK